MTDPVWRPDCPACHLGELLERSGRYRWQCPNCGAEMNDHRNPHLEYPDTTVLLPTLNEAETVAGVIAELHGEGLHDVVVIDGGSTDGTRELAAEAGARVEVQSGEGKGQAVREAMARYVDAERVVMLDADGTYDVGGVRNLLARLDDGADHVVAKRLPAPGEKPWPAHRLVGNLAIELVFELRHGLRADVLSGARAWTTDAWHAMDCTADGWGVETEMTRAAAEREDVEVATTTVRYYERPDGSESKLTPLRAGVEILSEL
jgi:dolichol-phosphate mannosyltransferase